MIDRLDFYNGLISSTRTKIDAVTKEALIGKATDEVYNPFEDSQ